MIPLGAFELHSRLGQGGMGEVWRGVHRGQQVPVAVKLLTTSLARKATFRTAFRNEVRAAAGLEHPHIVMVFDYGTVDERTQEASEGALRAGTPWLAMELAEDGSLEERRHVRSWRQLRTVLLSLLDALAHAHARGVVHRDIKPGNVLVDGEQGIKLTDFGLAHAMDREDRDFVAGTPSYMAPEQFEARWRDYGPWTDLYAVGCLVHALCSGEPPYGIIHDWHAGHRAHTRDPVPELESRFRVPDALQDWTRRLLARDPTSRFRRAADAALGLLQVPETVSPARSIALPAAGVLQPESTVPVAFTIPASSVTLTPELSSSAPGGAAPTATVPGPALVHQAAALSGIADHTRVPPTRARHTLVRPPIRPAVDSGPADVSRPRIPPLPYSWKRPDPPRRSLRLVGAGLGLFGLRTVPLVGRRAEQDRLWAALGRVHRTRQPHAVVIQGPDGCGKSRLLQWLGERAHEVGAARVMRARGDAGGVSGMLARFLRCQGLERAEVFARVSDWMTAAGENDPRAWEEVTGLVEGGPAAAVQLGQDRWRTLALLLRRVCAERPLVLLVDDGHDDPELLDMVRNLLDATLADLPVLLLVAARDDGRHAVHARLHALRGHPRGQGLDVGPLAETHRAELVRQLLHLEGPLAVEVERRTGGNPLFAVQLVGDWVQRGLLEPGRRGFQLREGAVPDVPDDLRAVWSDRLDGVLQGRGAADAVALELAAVLGDTVDASLWRGVCARAGVDASEGLVEALLARQLARCGDGGPSQRWCFEHALLTEILEDRAEIAHRLAEHHAVCADELATWEGRGIAERRGHHLVAAGRPEEAVEPLLAAVDERLIAGDLARANVLLAERQRALEQASIPGDDVRHAEGWVRWGRLAAEVGRLGEADAWAGRAVDEARRARWGRVLVDGLTLRGHLARRRGEVALAWRMLHEAETLAEGDPTGWRRGLVRLELGRLQVVRGQTDRGAELLRQAREDLEAVEDHSGVAEALGALSDVAVLSGRLGAAGVLVEWARGRQAWLGCRLGVARQQVRASRLARLRGAGEQASELLHEALDDLRALGTAAVLDAELELGWLALSRAELDLARSSAERALRAWTVHDLVPSVARAQALLLGAAVVDEDSASIERHLQRLARHLERFALVDVDVRRVLLQVQMVLEVQGDATRAGLAARLAEAQTLAIARGRRAA